MPYQQYPNYSLSPREVCGWTYPPDIRRELPKYRVRLANAWEKYRGCDEPIKLPYKQRFEALRAIVDILEAKLRVVGGRADRPTSRREALTRAWAGHVLKGDCDCGCGGGCVR